MALTVGVLSDSYRRQLRQLTGRVPIDVVLEKITALQDEFGIRPLGLDFGVHQLASTAPAYLDDLRRQFDRQNIVPTVIIGTLELHPDADVWKPALQRTAAELETAHRLGSALGFYFFKYGGRTHHEGRKLLAIEQIRRLAEIADKHGIVVVTENYDYFGSADFQEIFAAIDSRNVGLTNDTGNWLLRGEDPVEATRKMLPYTYHAHVRDYRIGQLGYTSVPIGQGEVDIRTILGELQKLAEMRQQFVLSVEMDLDDGDSETEDQAVRDCVRYMAEWLAGRSAART